MLRLLIATIFLVAMPASAIDVFPDLIAGTYTFNGQPAAADPDVTPTASIGAVRVDGAPGDQGVLDCEEVDQTNYSAVLPFTVALTDTTQNARVKLVAFAQAGCTGLQSPESENTAVMWLVPPGQPLLTE